MSNIIYKVYAPPDIIRSETKDSVSSYGPTRMVRNVKQARNGDILIASYTGVWRYDGKLFTNITSAISSPSFWDVLEDRKGNLWFGTKDSGIYCYPSASLRTGGKSILHYTTRQGLASNMALHIYEDRAGNTFTVLKNKDGKTFTNVWGITEDRRGNIWFGSGGGVYRYDGKTITDFKSAAGQQ
jgi:ligand-binding sensor domain-containing protein